MSDEQPVRPATKWKNLPGWERLPTALWLVSIGLVAHIVIAITHRVLTTRQLALLRDVSREIDHHAIFSTLEFYARVFPALEIASMAAAVVGLVYLTRAPKRFGIQILAILASVGMGLILFRTGVIWIEDLVFDDRSVAKALYDKWPLVMTVLVDGASMFFLLVVLVRTAKTIRCPLSIGLVASAGVSIACNSGFDLYRLLARPRLSLQWDSPWVYLLVTTAVWAVAPAIFAYSAAQLARVMDRHSDVPGTGQDGATEATSGLLSSPEWSRAAGGLELYAHALSWRVSAAVCGYLLLFMGIVGKSIGTVRLVGWLLPLVSLLIGIAMLSGMYSWAKQPDGSPGRGAAWLAFVAMVHSFLLDIYSFILIAKIMTVDQQDYGAMRSARAAAERAQSLSLWAMAIGFLGLLVLLVSLSQVARRLNRSDIAQRVVGIGIFLVVAAGLSIGFRSYIPEARIDIGGAVTLALGVLAMVLIAVISYIRVLHALVRAIREDETGAELPSARLL